MNSIGAKKTVDAKRGHLGSPAAKGKTAPFAIRLATGGVSIPGFDVARATALGQGYVLMQVKKRGSGADSVATKVGPTALQAGNLPEIPEKDLEALLKELAESGFSPLTRIRQAPKLQAQPRPELPQILDENRAFMDKLTQQSLADRARQVENGFLLTSANLCERRQISRQALSKAVKDGRVFWLDGPSGVQLYPEFFARPKSERLAFEKVSRALGNMPGASKRQFFTTPKRSLGGISPVEALDQLFSTPKRSRGKIYPVEVSDQGDMESVIAAAVAFGER